MTAVTRVVKKSFMKEGVPVSYERLTITGYVSGERMELELSIGRAELQLAKAILNSTEEAPTTELRKPTDDESEAYSESVRIRNSGETVDFTDPEGFLGDD